MAVVLVNVSRCRHKVRCATKQPLSPALSLRHAGDLESAITRTDFGSQFGSQFDTLVPTPARIEASGAASIREFGLSRSNTKQKPPRLGAELQHHAIPDHSEEDSDDKASYTALCILAWMVPVYFVGLQLLGGIALGRWIVTNQTDILEVNKLNAWWWAFFNSISSFNNCGMSLLDANMVPFARHGKFVLLTQSFLILAGNSCFPVFLRLLCWIMGKFSRKGSEIQAGLEYLMDEKKGRLIFPYIFSSMEVWWLSFTIVALNGIDWAAFEIAAPGTTGVRDLTVSERLVAGLFQAFAVRSGGFSAVTISNLHIGVQFLYAVMSVLKTQFFVALPLTWS